MAIDSRTVSYSIIVPVFNEEAVLPICAGSTCC
ncbi:hypothetical protein ABIC08_007760 [Bradyrhizobium sp. RT9b]